MLPKRRSSFANHPSKRVRIMHFSVFIFFLALFSQSCYNDPGFLGNNLLPDGDIYKVRVDSSFTVSAFTVANDSLDSFLASEGVIGYMNNEIFGSTKASFIGRYLPGKSTDGYGGPTAAPDSLVFYFTASSFYGDSTSQLNLKIHEITDTALFWNPRNSLKPITGFYNPTPLLTTTLKGKGEIKVSLPQQFAQFLMDSLALTDPKIFYTKYKGFYITCDEVPGFGGVTYNFLVSNTYLRLFYHYTKQVNGKDSTFKASKTYTFGSRFFEYLHDPSKADPAKKINRINDTINQDTVFYIQSMGGVYGKIKFADLTKWRDSMPVIIHRAELLIGRDNPATSTQDSLVNQLVVFYKDGGKWQGYIKDQLSSSGVNSNGSYLKYSNEYSINITYHFQKLLKGEYSDENLYIFPNSNTTIKRAVLKSGTNSKPIRLKITYTKLK